MKRFHLLVVLGLACLFAAIASAAAGPVVLTSIKPIHSLVAGIMQGVGEPQLLIDGSVPPWDFVPDTEQRQSLAKADLVVWTGRELEPALAPLLSRSKSSRVVVEILANDDLKILPARGGASGSQGAGRDAFFWLDSRNMLILLDRLTETMVRLDPINAASYERNRVRSFESIAGVDRVLEYGYRDVSGVPVFLFHDTHQYFEQAYAMNVVDTVASPPGNHEALAARLLTMKEGLSAASQACLFTERGLDEPHLDLLVSGSGVVPVELDSMGSGLTPGPDLYVELMRKNYETIAACVKAYAPQGGAADTAPTAGLPDIAHFPEQVTPRYLLIDQYGHTVSNNDFAGRFQLINFGYTHCPDVCPTTLSIMTQTLRLLGPDAEQVQPIFVTVDPARDTPEVLREYVNYFDPRILGLSSSPAVIKRTAELFRARFDKVPAPDGDPDRYTMDHTASLYLIGRNGEFVTKFAHGLPPVEVVEKLRAYMAL